VVLFLSLALLPVGLLAVLQTAEVLRQADQRSAASLATLTDRAAEIERQRIERAFGAAQGLGVVTLSAGGDGGRCASIFRTFVKSNPPILSAALSDPSGRPLCGFPDPQTGVLAADWPDAPGSPDRSRWIEIGRSDDGQGPVQMLIRQTIVSDGQVRGHVHLSLAYGGVAPTAGGGSGPLPDFLTISADGAILWLPDGLDDAARALPAGRDLTGLDGAGAFVFNDRAMNGVPRQFAVTPIVPDLIYIVGSWARDAPAAGIVPLAAPVPLFPILMWLVSLGVAIFAVNRLMIRHVRDLQRSMRRFARTRTLPDETFGADMPAELAEIAATFASMAGTVIRDEAELERNLHDRDVLLKEVHHRVKNNLQLISSLMNMKMRQIRSPEGKAVLRRLQDRVLGLAAIHRNLHESGNLVQVDAETLLTEILQQLSGLRDGAGEDMAVSADFAPVRLYPDQAVPLSLLASETFTNAFKHLGVPTQGQPWVRASLRREPDGRLALEVANSVGPDDPPPTETSAPADHGLGLKLIRAFCQQLGGELETTRAEDRHVVTFRFRPKPFASRDHEGVRVRPAMDSA